MANKVLTTTTGQVIKVPDGVDGDKILTYDGSIKSLEIELTENTFIVDVDTTEMNLNGLFQISYIVSFGSVNNEVFMRINNRTDSIYRNYNLDITNPAYNNKFWSFGSQLNKLWCIRNCSIINNELILDSSIRGHTITNTYLSVTRSFNTDGLNEASINSIKFYSSTDMQVGSIFKITKLT